MLPLLAVSWMWTKSMARSVMTWVMLALPTGIAWAVQHAGASQNPSFNPLWLVFAQLMTGLMLASGHWLQERDQGTWDTLRISAVPLGGLIAMQALLVSGLALGSEVLVFVVIHGDAPWSLPLFVAMLAGTIPATMLGVLIGVAGRSGRSGNMLATVVMLVLFLGTITVSGLTHYALLAILLHGLPSILAMSALNAGLAGHYAAFRISLGLSAWFLVMVALLTWTLRRRYLNGQ